MIYVLDTHSLVWFLTDDDRFGINAQTVIEHLQSSDLIAIPIIVLAEIMTIAKKGRISISFEDILNFINTTENIEIFPLDLEILKIANSIKTNLEMHDRLIVATTISLNANLLTKDEAIIRSGIVKTVW